MWTCLSKVTLLLALTAIVGAANPPSCKKVIIRKEWRSLSLIDRFQYLSAVNCLMAKKAKTPRTVAPGVVSRYEDFVVTHIQKTFEIHYVGQFLPWHRYFTAVYEQALRKECGYTGAQPYWDWNLDVSSGTAAFLNSPIFDSALGFGGNGAFVQISPEQQAIAVPGRTGGGCVKDGAFKNMKVRMGPGPDLSGNPRCLTRDFSPYFAGRYLGKNQTVAAMAVPTFYKFDRIIEGGPSFEQSGMHGGGHYGIGGMLGTMGDLYISPNDPLFYLHHANLDRVWWSWQRLSPQHASDISGPVVIMDYGGLSPNVTLEYPLSLGAYLNAPNVTIRDVMDVRGPTLCYDYDQVYRRDGSNVKIN